jgi:hypothetical protein
MCSASVGAFDGDKPSLLLLCENVAVEYLNLLQADVCQSFSSPYPPQLNSERLREMRGPSAQGVMVSSGGSLAVAMSGDDIVMAEIMPFCWARRETVVALLRKQGIGLAEMSAWFPAGAPDEDEPTGTIFNPYPTGDEGSLSPKVAVTREVLRRIWPNGWPDGMSFAAMARAATSRLKLLGWERRDVRDKIIAEFNESDIKRAVGRK